MQMTYVAEKVGAMGEVLNQEAANTIIDLHRGVHAALDALVSERDYEKAELIRHQLDERFARMRGQAETMRFNSQ